MILQQIFNFLVLGSMYSLVALGFTLYFGTVGLINFAHGELCMIGAFVALVFLNILNPGFENLTYYDFIIAIILSMAICIVIGLLSEYFIFRKIRSRPKLEGLIISIALSMLLRELVLHFYPNGGNPQPFPDPFNLQGIQISDVYLSYINISIIVACLILTSLFYIFVKKTNIGRNMRAISQDSEAALMIGLPINKTILISFGIGALFASVAGIANGATYGSIKFDMGISLGIKGFIAAVIGGLDNPRGALWGGLLIAFLETIIVAVFPGGSSYRDIVAFSILIMFLLIKPDGLLGPSNDSI